MWFAEHDLRIIKGEEEKNPPKIKNPSKIKNLMTFETTLFLVVFVHPRAAGRLVFERFRTLSVLKYICKIILITTGML